MRTASDIIQDLGGPAEVAKETGIPLTTVIGWRDANFIPEWRRDALKALAEQKAEPIADEDFPPKSERRPRGSQQAVA